MYVLRYADKDAGTFYNFKLPANPIPPPGDEVIHDNELLLFIIDKLNNWTEIFEDTNNPPIPNMTLIPFTGEREVNSMGTLLMKRSIV